MIIRKYERRDRDACLKIFDSNVPKYFDQSERAGFELFLDGIDDGVARYKNSAADFYFILEDNNILLACGGFYIKKNQPAAGVWLQTNTISKVWVGSFCISG